MDHRQEVGREGLEAAAGRRGSRVPRGPAGAFVRNFTGAEAGKPAPAGYAPRWERAGVLKKGQTPTCPQLPVGPAPRRLSQWQGRLRAGAALGPADLPSPRLDPDPAHGSLPGRAALDPWRRVALFCWASPTALEGDGPIEPDCLRVGGRQPARGVRF